MAARPMRFAWANLALLLFVVCALVTGVAGLLGSSDPFRIVSWLHAASAYAIVVLLFAKGMLVLDAIRRRPGLTQARVTLTLLVALLRAVLVTGLVWITIGRAVYVLGISLVNLHAYLALLVLALLAWHVVDRRWIVRVPAARDRRAFLKLAAVALGGVALWQLERAAQALLDTPGSRRRFTGSYETGSFTGSFPAVSWLNDDPDPVDAGSYRLVVDGAVARPLELAYDELRARPAVQLVATLDCTGGWFSRQRWQGVPLSALLAEARPAAGAESVLVESVTGYGRRFSIADADRLVLATHVAGQPLSHGHGFPARLVVPDQRGFDWVKWVGRIAVLESSHLLQPPLPLE